MQARWMVVPSLGLAFLVGSSSFTAARAGDWFSEPLPEKQSLSLEERVALLEEQQAASAGANMLKVFWKDSLRLETEDKSVKLRIGGRAHLDQTFVSEDSDVRRAVGSLSDNTQFRRARMYLSGQVDQVEFKFQFEFAGGGVAFRDMYVGLVDVPYLGTLRGGQMKEPFSLEQLTSSNEISFIERSLADAFTPGRTTGIQSIHSLSNKRLGLAVGAFKDGTAAFGDAPGDDAMAGTGRVFFIPLESSNGRNLIHTGASMSVRRKSSSVSRFRSRPEAVTAGGPRFVDTGNITDVDMETLAGLEAAGIFGSFSVQGEAIFAFVDTGSRSNAQRNSSFHGHYLQGSWLVTGERRGFDTSKGVFKSPKPENDFSTDQCGGAIELLLRFSQIDLNSAGVRGGEETNYTAGANWYLNPNTRVMLNYILARLNPGAGTSGYAQFLVTRLQFNF